MEQHHQKALTMALPDLTANINIARVEVILLQGGIFTEDEFREIKDERNEERRVRKLVEMLKRSGPKAYPTFMRALKNNENYDHLVLKLEKLARGETTDTNEIKPTTRENQPVSDALRDKIELYLPNELTDWKFVGRNLGITNPKLTQIERDNHTQREKIVAMLTEWFQNGKNRELPFLAKALLDAGRRDLSEWVTARSKEQHF